MKTLSPSQALIFLSNIINDHSGALPLVIAIDGKSASGKTTFAQKLSELSKAPVIHTDDFFRPRDSFGNLHISDFDGNFDIDRFKREAVNGILSHEPFEHGVFDCKQGKITKVRTFAKSHCFIVEGAYSLNPNLGDYANIKVFFDVSRELQKQRIINRGGIDSYNSFESLWIPSEERYFSHYDIRKNVDFYVEADLDIKIN